MQIIKNTGNRESIYELTYDKETIKNLISSIIKACSIRKKGKSYIEAQTYDDAKNKINSITDWNGNKVYINVTSICDEPVNDPFDYWRHGDPLPYSFTSDVLISPQLVNFLIRLINGEDVDYDWFINRKELTRKQDMQLEMQELDSQINKISNYDTKLKIEKLEELARKVQAFNDIPEFDYDLLAKYYELADISISLVLVQETFKYQKTITPPKKDSE